MKGVLEWSLCISVTACVVALTRASEFGFSWVLFGWSALASLLAGFVLTLIVKIFREQWVGIFNSVVLLVAVGGLIIGNAYVSIDDLIFQAQAEESDLEDFRRARLWPMGSYMLNNSEDGIWVHD